MLKLAGQEDRDEDLVDGTLDEDDADETKDGVRDVPELEEPLFMYVSVSVQQIGVRILTKNSKNATMPITPRKWAMNAMTDPNLGYLVSRRGPRNRENMKRMRSTAASQTIGPREMTAIRMSGLAG